MKSHPSADPFALIRHWDSERTQKGWWHSFELPDGTFIEGVCDLKGLKNRIAQFPIANDLRGKRVLDIGTWDGWFAFEMERRGAEVMAIDCWDNPRFREIHARIRSRVEYRQMDFYKLTPGRVGRFDIVLFMGVLYHLKHPLLALERVCALTTDMAAVDSFILREEHRPGDNVERRAVMEFYETNEMGGQTDNWIGPSLPCLLALCRTAGFARAQLQSVIEHSACIACYRRWEAPQPGASASAEPYLIDARHNGNQGINCESDSDEYVSIWFDCEARSLIIDDVRPQVAGYGVRPLHLAKFDDRTWQTNFKLPPGLAPGWHDVAIRLGESRLSNVKPIAVDIPLSAGHIELAGVSDGTTWIGNELDLAKGRTPSLWVSGLPGNVDRNNLRIYLAGHRLNISYIGNAGGNEARQVNADAPEGLQPGQTQIGAAIGEARSQPVNLTIR